MNLRRDQEELLNSFVDGELSERQCEEVKRLAGEDPAIRKRLHELKNLRALVSGLPRIEAPAGLEHVLKERLTVSAGVGGEHAGSDNAPASRTILLRKICTLAAMVILGLAVSVAIKFTDPGPVPSGQGGLRARLECRSSQHATVEMVINRAIHQHGLLSLTERKTEGDAKTYLIRAPQEVMSAFLEDFSRAWPTFDQPSLRLETHHPTGPLVLESLSASQMTQIFGRENADERLELAQRIATENNLEPSRDADARLAQAISGHDGDALVPGAPNPMLTSGDSTAPSPIVISEAMGELAELTIVLRPSAD
jgi:hypothetical protein